MDNSAKSIFVEEQAHEFREIGNFEPKWLYDIRKKAWDFYHSSPLPNKSTNVWRYTEPSNFIIEDLEPLLEIAPLLPDDSTGIEPGPDQAGYGYNTIHGRIFATLSENYKEKGIILKDLHSSIKEHGELLKKYFGKIVGPEFGKFEALNMALWNTGLFFYVPPNVILDKPIYLNRQFSERHAFTRLLVIVGENSQATIIDNYSGNMTKQPGYMSSGVELYAGDFANVRYVNIQNLGENAKGYLTTRARIGRDTNLTSIYGGIGGKLTKANVGAILSGKGSNSRIYGIVFGDSSQRFDYHTAHIHEANETFSNLNFKVALKDKAASAYTGLIRIEKDTVNCQAYQENRNLLLNAGTKADSIPELEILTDQVICTHGATMGPIDPEMVFYLKSRGIGETEAVNMIVAGFVEPMLNEMPASISDMMKNMVNEKLKGA